MQSSNSPELNPIENFIEDEIYFDVKKKKEPLEKATIVLFVFTSLSLVFYIIGLLLTRAEFDWYSCTVNLLIFGIYFCIAVYSSHKPFNGFVAAISLIVTLIIIAIIFTGHINPVALLVRAALIVYFSSLLKSAKQVQAFDLKNK